MLVTGRDPYDVETDPLANELAIYAWMLGADTDAIRELLRTDPQQALKHLEQLVNFEDLLAELFEDYKHDPGFSMGAYEQRFLWMRGLKSKLDDYRCRVNPMPPTVTVAEEDMFVRGED